jgi:AcrR family transcriptional regulator
MLDAARVLLDSSPDHDISTRSVCDAVGVGAPMLYRLFGDKSGLLAAVVDDIFERYLSRKRIAQLSKDPVDDLYAAWDAHAEFALKNPIVYRIAYAPSMAAVPAGVEEARQLLLKRLTRCATAGRLNTTPDQAAQAIMAAGIGVNLCLISQPTAYADPHLSQRVRDAVLQDLLVDQERKALETKMDRVKNVALQMAALSRETSSLPLTGQERALMLQWLDAISAANGAASLSPSRDQSR